MARAVNRALLVNTSPTAAADHAHRRQNTEIPGDFGNLTRFFPHPAANHRLIMLRPSAANYVVFFGEVVKDTRVFTSLMS